MGGIKNENSQPALMRRLFICGQELRTAPGVAQPEASKEIPAQ